LKADLKLKAAAQGITLNAGPGSINASVLSRTQQNIYIISLENSLTLEKGKF
jgi:hypothetical protein